ncbi:MAG: OB-fold domain-containing protein [Acidimicrobiales bacterium]
MTDPTPRYLPAEWTLPAITDHNEAFFTSGELRLETCRACRSVQHPPIGVCIECGGLDHDYIATTPTGRIDGFTIVHHAVHPLLAEKVPYNVVVVALDDHPDLRVVGNLLDVTPESVTNGAKVRCSFTDPLPSPNGGPAVRLPQWVLESEQA